MTVHNAAAYRVGGHRCRECRDAHAVYVRSMRDRRRAERTEVDGRLVHPDATHGTRSGYEYHGCRCVDCTAANTNAHKKWRVRRAA